ncbi:MAG: tetratricopeptide repeat protein [Proteobacteria bacterium]|nr:tetratricopeptide repeat protein [Pseudomonadota bacterium]
MENIKELIAAGKQCFEGRQYRKAEEYLRRAIEMNPNFADVLNMLGVIAHSEGRFASSIDCFQRALEINPGYTEAMLNLAVLYNDLGQYDDARRLYEKLKGRTARGTSKIEPVLRGKLSNLHADIGDIYRSIGLFDMASDEYRKALTLNPTYFDIRTKLGQSLREGGRPKEAVSELKAVLKANGRYAPALVQLGVTHYAMGNIPDAKRSWKKAMDGSKNPYAEMYLRLCAATERSSGKVKVKAKVKDKVEVKGRRSRKR